MQLFEGYLSIWKIIEHWAHFYWCKWPPIEQIIRSHWLETK